MNIFEKYNLNVKNILLKLTDENWNQFFQKNKILTFEKNIQYQIKCPFHRDKSPSLGINTNYNTFNCFVCTDKRWTFCKWWKEENLGKWPFIYHFLKLFYNKYKNKELTNKELIELCWIKKEQEKEFLLEVLNWRKSFSKNKTKYKKTEALKKIEISELNQYKNSLSYITNRLSLKKDVEKVRINKTLEHFYIWYDKNKKILSIPIFQDWYLRWIYWRRKIPFEGTRYTNITSFPKTSIIYNYDEVIEKYEDVILVEGPLNAIRLWSLWYENVISLFWAKAFNEQIIKLNKFKNIYLWFDNDEAWHNWIKGIRKNINSKTNLFYVFDNDKTKVKDAYDLNKNEINELFQKFKNL